MQLSHINKQFSLQREIARSRNSQIFEVLKQDLTKDEYLAFRFLYAYMPLSDLADYSGQYFLENIRMSLKAKDEMAWGKSVPESIFLHFVLPVRVNNENLDSFRIICYDELKKRVSGLTMYKAALEVNHWCHEKVTYKGSDERTSSPLSSMRYSFGRCGEESTFTVSALRMIGIPARQVYTPRWAHSDDNHAWVEVWVDGKWYFMGACEPEPDLNMGWFAAPALRTMLVHTRAFGWYNGNEPVVSKNETFSELNLIENYAPAKQITVKVIDEKSVPVENAKVEFQLYNYSEFFPIATTYTENGGLTSLKMGLGDIIVWVNKDDKFEYKKISVESTDTLSIVIKDQNLTDIIEEYDLIPPVERESVKASNEGRSENDKRLAYEDKIRTQYMATFKDSMWASVFAESLNINADSTVLFITKSYGNWKEIAIFLQATKPNYRKYALKLLSVISEKDLRDTKAAILSDYLYNAVKYLKNYKGNEEIWAKYVLSGRVANENMVSCKELYNFDFFSSKGSDKINLSPLGIKDVIIKKIKINKDANALSRNPLTPVGVYQLKVADFRSRDIFFVTMCRANGFAARLQPETLIPQYWNNNIWENVIFEAKSTISESKGIITLKNISNLDPKYYINFTLAYFKNGVYRTFQFNEEQPLSAFAKEIEAPAGKYMLVTGSRQQNGSVLSRLTFFELKPGEKKEVEVKVRESKIIEKPWGKINTDIFSLENIKTKQIVKLNELLNNKPFIIVFIDPDKEPTKHVMVDLKPVRNNFENWDGKVIFLLRPKNSSGFNSDMFPNLPSKSQFYIDYNEELIKKLSELKSTSLENDLPVIIMGDSQGNLTYFSKGYKIGVGEQLVKNLK
ncbi:MAG: transglutaminase domain-containing protein [Bacteroidia bacterium]|nr:transglutaminase domain-containing protein [Bacteroidia bacterium]